MSNTDKRKELEEMQRIRAQACFGASSKIVDEKEWENVVFLQRKFNIGLNTALKVKDYIQKIVRN